MAEPTEPKIIRDAIVSWLADAHTSIPGKVVSYDPVTQAASVQPAVQRAVESTSGGWVHFDYPVIPNVLVGWLAGGGCSLQMPLAAGDSVWLLFSESCWAQYRSSGQVAPPGDHRRFDLSYPIALPVQLVSALRSVADPHFEVPAGKVLTVGGDPAGTQFVALANLVSSELARINSDMSALKSAVASGLTAVGVGMAANGPAGAAAFNASASAVPSAAGPVAAEKLKTE